MEIVTLAAADAVTLADAWPYLVAGVSLLVAAGTLLSRRDATRRAIEEAQSKSDCAKCRREVDGGLQTLRDSINERPRRESLDEAFRTIRELEARVVAGEKATLELKGDLKLVLGATAEMKQMLAQLQSDVSVALRRAIGRQRTGEPGADEP